MLYDLAREPPEPGTLLESVFLLIAKMRQESRFLETRLLVEAALRPHVEDSNSFQKAYQDYTDSLFPFAAKDRRKESQSVKEALGQWTSHKALRVRPIGGGSGKSLHSRLKRAAGKVLSNDTPRGKKIG